MLFVVRLILWKFLFGCLKFRFISYGLLLKLFNKFFHFLDFFLIGIFNIFGRSDFSFFVEIRKFWCQKLISLSRKSEFLFGIHFELKILFVEFLVLVIGFLDFFKTFLDFLVHHLFDLFNLGLFLLENILSILFFGNCLQELLLLFTDFKVEHFDLFYEGYSVLASLVFESVVLLNRFAVFFLEHFEFI